MKTILTKEQILDTFSDKLSENRIIMVSQCKKRTPIARIDIWCVADVYGVIREKIESANFMRFGNREMECKIDGDMCCIMLKNMEILFDTMAIEQIIKDCNLQFYYKQLIPNN